MSQYQKVRLTRAQIGKATGIDTTVKSAQGWARHFAPTWEMVMGHKRGTVSDEEYTRLYREILERVPQTAWKALWDYGLAHDNGAALLCYCRDGKFCHTHQAVEFAVERWGVAFEDGR